MKSTRSNESINRRCQTLISMGFEINHQDSDVYHPKLGPDVCFDFSAIGDDHLISHALKVAYKFGIVHGSNQVRKQLAELLTPIDVKDVDINR